MILSEIKIKRIIKQGAEKYSQLNNFISWIKLKRTNLPLYNKLLVTLLINKDKIQ